MPMSNEEIEVPNEDWDLEKDHPIIGPDEDWDFVISFDWDFDS